MSDRFSLFAEAAKCYRIFATATPDIQRLRISLLDPTGHEVGSCTRLPSVAPEKAPFCPTSSGDYTVEVAVEKGSGTYYLQAWAR